ncbi:MAG: VWA domain-containing protein [Chloroflexi bacterium]|nr:VWA domain-containing protein [Chloroflexota bacterium]
MNQTLRIVGNSLIAIIGALLVLAGTALVAPPHRAAAQTGCASTIDLVVVVDGSESISWSEFDLMQSFISDLVGGFAITPDDGQVGLVQFASEGQGRVEIALTGDAAAVQGALFNMVQIVGVTDIQEGLALGQEQLSLNGRAGVPHVLLLLTDGEHNQPGDPIAEAELARSLGTEIFAVGIGDGAKIGQLNAIVSAPASEHVISVYGFSGLVAILETLVQIVCPPTPTPTETATSTPIATSTPLLSETPGATATPVREILDITELRLPAVGNTMPPELEQRGGHMLAQALAGVGVALALLAATYRVVRRAKP